MRDYYIKGCTKLVPFLKYWNHICFFPFWWFSALIYWKSVVSIGAMIGASSLRSCVGMRFEPAAFCTFRFDKSLNTPFFVISIRLIVGCGLGPLSGIVLLCKLKSATQKECRKAYKDYVESIFDPDLSSNPKDS
jgi:hypothetical protein